MSKSKPLSEKSSVVLRLIAAGRSYGQIVEGHPDISYLDIFTAAEEALRLDKPQPDYQARVKSTKARYARAYEKWTAKEEETLTSMHTRGESLAKISARLQRQPTAIRSRIAQMDLSERWEN